MLFCRLTKHPFFFELCIVIYILLIIHLPAEAQETGTRSFLTGLWHGAEYNFILWGLFWIHSPAGKIPAERAAIKREGAASPVPDLPHDFWLYPV
jgi:hypothetical protein